MSLSFPAIGQLQVLERSYQAFEKPLPAATARYRILVRLHLHVAHPY